MPTYKFTPAATDKKREFFFDKKRILPTEEFETAIYLSSDFLTANKLTFVKDDPYISPVIVSTGKITASIDLTIPDSNWSFDLIVAADSGVTLELGFNGDTTSTNKIYIVGGYTTVIRNLSGRAIRIINATLSGSGSYCLSCVRNENGVYQDNLGI